MRRLVCLIGFGLLAALPLRAASLEEDVRAADASRVLATIAGNVTRLEPLLSNREASLGPGLREGLRVLLGRPNSTVASD